MLRKFLGWLQERIKHWEKPATSVLIIRILPDLTRSRTDLVVENTLLRQQLIVLERQIKRAQLTNPERFHLVFLSHFTKFWKHALALPSLCYIENCWIDPTLLFMYTETTPMGSSARYVSGWTVVKTERDFPAV